MVSGALGQWKRMKEFVLTGEVKNTAANRPGKYARKRAHATSYIRYIALHYADKSPYEGKEDLDVLPYEDVKSLYNQYRSHCTATLYCDRRLSYLDRRKDSVLGGEDVLKEL
jgi:hypothetical protein